MTIQDIKRCAVPKKANHGGREKDEYSDKGALRFLEPFMPFETALAIAVSHDEGQTGKTQKGAEKDRCGPVLDWEVFCKGLQNVLASDEKVCEVAVVHLVVCLGDEL